MVLEIKAEALLEIHNHGEKSYPEEGAGLMLGSINEEYRRVTAVVKLVNRREDAARHNRYLIGPQDYLYGEQEADRLGLDVIGVFHSHPDHPNQPSEFDREWALPWFSYVITQVAAGQATGSRSWRLGEDRRAFVEEKLEVIHDL